MRGQEFRARDKKVQKMTRDGLTEKNLAAGTEERISGRLADVSFGREKTEDTAAGRRAQSRIRKTMRGSGVPARDTGKKAEGRNQPGAERRRIAKKGNAGEKRQDRTGKCRRQGKQPGQTWRKMSGLPACMAYRKKKQKVGFPAVKRWRIQG